MGETVGNSTSQGTHDTEMPKIMQSCSSEEIGARGIVRFPDIYCTVGFQVEGDGEVAEATRGTRRLPLRQLVVVCWQKYH